MNTSELEELATNIAEVASWILEMTEKLPALKQRRGGLGHTIPEPRDPQECATRKSLALLPPTSKRKLAAPPPRPPKAPKGLRVKKLSSRQRRDAAMKKK